MKPGDLVQLPDGSFGYYQRTLEDGRAIILKYAYVQAKDLKPSKEPT